MQTAIVTLLVLLGTLTLSVVAGAVYQIIETRRDRRRFPPPGRLVRFNKRRMHIHVTGEGTPTVVFESGMGASCLSWTLVQPQVAKVARAVSYDRAGHGWSGRGLASAGMGGDECVRRRRILGSATDRGRDSQAARTDLAGRARIMVAAEEFHEPGTIHRGAACQCCASGCGGLAWGFATGRAFGRPPCGAVH